MACSVMNAARTTALAPSAPGASRGCVPLCRIGSHLVLAEHNVTQHGLVATVTAAVAVASVAAAALSAVAATTATTAVFALAAAVAVGPVRVEELQEAELVAAQRIACGRLVGDGGVELGDLRAQHADAAVQCGVVWAMCGCGCDNVQVWV
eukprot:123580-Chlamydomonas_euryale.AAC.1